MGQCRTLFHQSQLNVFDRDRLARGRLEFFENFNCARRVGAADDEFFAAPENRYVKRGGNLAQIFIHRAAQVGKLPVIERLGREMQRL